MNTMLPRDIDSDLEVAEEHVDDAEAHLSYVNELLHLKDSIHSMSPDATSPMLLYG